MLDLIATKVSYVVQEGVCVIKVSRKETSNVNLISSRPYLLTHSSSPPLLFTQDIFRKYPHQYEGIIATLCSNLEDLDEPEAKASLIWILGEYSSSIENASELLSSFLDGFVDEPYQVQFATLTAIVKLFLQKPQDAQHAVQSVLEKATKECENADIRDRAYVYWRLLSSNDQGAAKVSGLEVSRFDATSTSA